MNAECRYIRIGTPTPKLQPCLLLAIALAVVLSACGRSDLVHPGARGVDTKIEGLAMVAPEPGFDVPPTPTTPMTNPTTPPLATSTEPSILGASVISSASSATSAPTTSTTIAPLTPPTFDALAGIHTIRDFTGLTSRGPSKWERSVPGIERLSIPSTLDDAEQPLFWLPPGGEGDQPLLVILHSWSSTYTQHAGIPFAMWAQENGWAVVAPEFRGINDDANAVGSELAVQDAVDAIDFATAHDSVDSNRVYVVGYSGGGMMALLLAGRHPDKVTAVSAWGPPADLVDFYGYSRARGRRYAGDIWRACGGDPRKAGAVQDECVRRSPMTYLDAAREHEVPVFIGQGIRDVFVSPSVGATVFNELADPDDRLNDEQLDELARKRVPVEEADAITTETFFGDGDPTPVFARQSGAALLVYFSAGHDMVYQAAARWFATDPR